MADAVNGLPLGPVAGAVNEEIRFAVVMYGGVSLCVYMCGITEQLLKLVQSTARKDGDNSPFYVDIDGPNADPLWRVYRRAAAIRSERNGDVTCRFVVDILAGTSAGGLNSMFLAKALANDQPIDDLKRLWIIEGDIGLLVNDRGSEAATGKFGKAFRETPPQSLLNSHRMAQRLLEALRGMESGAPRNDAWRSPYVDRLDLFMTATDLQGLDESLGVSSDATITERRHRAVFHFAYDVNDSGYLPKQTAFRNDFVPDFTPFFTFVARSTSSIVPAFEPMRLDDLRLLNDPGNQAVRYDPAKTPEAFAPFFRDYWISAAARGDGSNRLSNVRVAKTEFAFRAFGDGGYGDNYPFGPAIGELRNRQESVKVSRKFLYVEPDPDLRALDDVAQTTARPDVFAHLSAMNSVKSTETIRGDIAALRERSWLLERLDGIRSAISGGETDELEGFAAREIPNDSHRATPYERLRGSAATDEIAEILTTAFGFGARSPSAHAIRYLVKVVRQEGYRGRYREFLDTFDLSYRSRAIRDRLRLLSDRDRAGRAGEAERGLSRRGLIDAARRISSIPSTVRVAAAVVAESEAAQPTAAPDQGGVGGRFYSLANFRTEEGLEASDLRVANLRQFIARLLGHLRRTDFDPILERSSVKRLSYILLGGRRPVVTKVTRAEQRASDSEYSERYERAKEVLDAEHYEERVEPIIELLANYVGPIVRATDEAIRAFDEQAAAIPGLGEEVRRLAVLDQFLFPVLYGSGAAEAARLDVLRVSPLDCKTLIADQTEAKTKLAGTGLGHFSGFFKAEWRAEDILWGRLDGAERLICAIVENDGFQRRKLILQAQLAILATSDDLEAVLEEIAPSPATKVAAAETLSASAMSIRLLRKKLTEMALSRFREWVRDWTDAERSLEAPWAERLPEDDATLRRQAIDDLFPAPAAAPAGAA